MLKLIFYIILQGILLIQYKKTSKICGICINSLGSRKPVIKNFSKHSLIKSYKKNTLFFCYEYTFCCFVGIESIFRKFYEIVSTQKIDVKNFYVSKMEDIEM